MKLSISNIAWEAKDNEAVYALMREKGFSGLEIAPTKIFPRQPYEQLDGARSWRAGLEEYGLEVSSMQSIWYGRSEQVFGSDDERQLLIDYTKRAVDFAHAVGCKNLVFGCPKNRSKPEGANDAIAVDFFRETGSYAHEKGSCIGMEANPPIYNTNYINTTDGAIALIERVNCPGFRLNLDVGTMLENGERVEALSGYVHLINHVHISEPYLKPIEAREMHAELSKLLREENYRGYVSIEMGQGCALAELGQKMEYVQKIFG